MPGKYQDDYDDYEEEDYYDDYDDAADDWEAEAAEEEEREQAEAAMKAALAEKKLQTRAPAATHKDADEEEEAEALPDDVMREVEHMRQMANDTAAGGDLVSGAEHTELLADAPCGTAEEARAQGVALAQHMLTFADAPNFDTVLASLFASLGKEFKTVLAINNSFTRAEKAFEASKRSGKAAKKKGGKSGNAHTAVSTGNDALNMDVEDKGGAYVEDGDAFF